MKGNKSTKCHRY